MLICPIYYHYYYYCYYYYYYYYIISALEKLLCQLNKDLVTSHEPLVCSYPLVLTTFLNRANQITAKALA